MSRRRERFYAADAVVEEAIVANESGGGSRAAGWLIWIGVIVGINVLSYAFDWGFWLY